MKAALEARRRIDHSAALGHLQAAHALAPGDTATMNGLAACHVRMGDLEGAMAWLEKVADDGAGFDPEANPVFLPLRDLPGYPALRERFARRDPPLGRSEPIFTLQDAALIPEGIAWDPLDRALFVSSMNRHKIVKVDAAGGVSDFTSEGQDGLLEVVGMKVDPARRHLWAASGDVPDTPDAPAASFLHQFDLTTGRLVRRVATPAGEQHFLNDLDLSADGVLYVSDSTSGAILRLGPDAQELTPLAPAGSFEFPNGVALSRDGWTLYVASYFGLAAVDTATGEFRLLPHPRQVTVLGIDGLYRDGDSLLAIQNGLGPGRVIRLLLSAAGDRITGAEVLESRHPLFDAPTTGAVAGDDFYYFANTQLDALQPDGRLDPARKLSPVVILRLPLR